MEPSWPPLVPTWLRTLLTLLSPQGHCPGWARGVFLPTPCPVYLLLLQTQQGVVASSVESAQPRRGHEDTLFSLLPYRDCKEIIKCATSPCLLTAFVSQGKTYPPLPGASLLVHLPPLSALMLPSSCFFLRPCLCVHPQTQGVLRSPWSAQEVLRDTGVLSQYGARSSPLEKR